jgi:hypothetical protein
MPGRTTPPGYTTHGRSQASARCHARVALVWCPGAVPDASPEAVPRHMRELVPGRGPGVGAVNPGARSS